MARRKSIQKKEQPAVKMRKIRGDDFEIRYCNGVTIVNTTRDFQFTFAQIMTEANGEFVIREHTLMSMSPQHAKSLFNLLQQRIKIWESNHGEIKP